MVILNLASAIILILLVMRQLRKGLDRMFGNHLVVSLPRASQNRYQAFLAGIVAGLIAPSSSAIAMLSVRMLSQTALTAGPMLAVVLGANVGLTVIVQLITFDLQNFASAFIVVGGIGFLFLSRALFRGSGQIFLGLGFIFLAMSMIADAGKAAAASQDMKLLFSIVDHYPWLVFATTALLALVLQSSTACIGLGIGLSKAGLVSGITLVPWILGANLGIGLTMMVAGWASVEGRRLALGSILLKGSAAILILVGGSSVAAWVMTLLPGGIERHAANLNTLFNCIVGLIALPILTLISRGLSYLVPSQTLEEQDDTGVFLDPLLLQTPSLALSQAAREELRILDRLRLMLRTVCALRLDQSKQAKIGEWYDRIFSIQAALKDYLGQIADENLRDSDIDTRFNLLDYSQELVIIGMLIKRDLADAAVARSLKEFQADDLAELENILSRTLERMQKATVLLMTQDVVMANRFIQEKEQISEHYRSVRKRHLERLVPGQNLSTGLFDLLNCFRRINSHLTAVAYAIVRGSSVNSSVVGPDPDESWLTGDRAVTRLKLATE